MEPLSETIALDIEESNELLFKVTVEGAGASPAKVRLVCEGDDVAYMFNGRGTGDEGVVQFMLPTMANRLKEGAYPARVEVLIENRYFTPLQFQIDFKKTVKVVAESLVVKQKTVQDLKVNAVPIVVKRPVIVDKPLVIESPPVKPVAVKPPPTPVVRATKAIKQPPTLQELYHKRRGVK